MSMDSEDFVYKNIPTNEQSKKKFIKPEGIRPNLYERITNQEKYKLRMRALAKDSIYQTQSYDYVLKM